ncbi:MAG: PD40 domain-containing protein, partial [Ardenticatenales bacterium]|nr:PD40 domain-containing protein [Ardenticatenales bacterium]
FSAERRNEAIYDLYLIDAEGSNRKLLTQGSDMTHLHPAWSPDGEQIAFTSTLSETMALYVMKADGTEIRQVTSETEGFTSPAWSPDGQTLLLQPDSEETGLYLIQADGSDLRQVEGITRAVTGATWSPDGQKIAFLGSPAANGLVEQLFVYDLASEAVTQITNVSPDTQAWYVTLGNWVAPDGSQVERR